MILKNPEVKCANAEVQKFEVRVPTNMGKIDIKNFLEKVHNIPVAKVNTMVVAGKYKRVRGGRTWYKRPDYKKAIVTVKKDPAGLLAAPAPVAVAE
tara:strand:- start:459 stop:746 length:288 start_codon:yes stop_codon:yes gene_type:complete